MTKSLIDLSRANKPTPPSETVKEPEPQIKPANANKPLTPARKEKPTTPTDLPSTIGARIPSSLHRNIKVFCLTHDIEMQQFVFDALTQHLEILQNQLG